MRTRNKHVKMYLKDIHDSLIGTKSMKAVMMSDLRSTTNDYVSDHPDCTFEDLYRDIGAPDEIARQYETPNSIQNLKKKAKKYTIVKWIALLTCITALAIAVIALYIITKNDYFYFNVNAPTLTIAKGDMYEKTCIFSRGIYSALLTTLIN